MKEISDVIIRKGEMADCRACLKLVKKYKALQSKEGVPPLWWIEGFAKDKRGIFFVAELDKKIIGFRLGEELLAHGALAQLIIVEEKYRRNGLGKSLMRAFDKESRRRKISWILTNVSAKKEVQSVYRKEGYLKGHTLVEHLKNL